MAYSTANPPALQSQTIGNHGQGIWVLMGTDAPAVVRVNGYITNAKALGLKVGDILHYFQTSGPAFQAFRVMAINTNGSADLNDGTTVAVTNTD